MQLGEEQEVSFTIGKEEISYYNDTKKDWFAEPGEFEARIGTSSADICSKIAFKLK